MFRLLRIIIRTYNELTQDYLTPSAIWDPVVLTIVGTIVLWVQVCYNVYSYLCYYEGWNFNSSNYLFTTDTK